ncbi:hypothetical protein HOH87_02730 [bacterium]|jgi:hypothetical protein|nr:hypothetical protein [bacterium]
MSKTKNKLTKRHAAGHILAYIQRQSASAFDTLLEAFDSKDQALIKDTLTSLPSITNEIESGLIGELVKKIDVVCSPKLSTPKESTSSSDTFTNTLMRILPNQPDYVFGVLSSILTPVELDTLLTHSSSEIQQRLLKQAFQTPTLSRSLKSDLREFLTTIEAPDDTDIDTQLNNYVRLLECQTPDSIESTLSTLPKDQKILIKENCISVEDWTQFSQTDAVTLINSLENIKEVALLLLSISSVIDDTLLDNLTPRLQRIVKSEMDMWQDTPSSEEELFAMEANFIRAIRQLQDTNQFDPNFKKIIQAESL